MTTTRPASAPSAAAASNAADALDRLPPIPETRLTDAQAHAAAEFRALRRQDVFGPFVPLLRSPEVMTRVSALGERLRFRSVLPPRLSELVILLVARRWTQQFEWRVHAPIARQAGLSEQTVQAIAEGRRPAQMADDEEILYSFCDELEHTRCVSDATYARAVAALGEQGLIETTALVGYYTLLAMVLNVARTPLPDAAAPPLAPLPG